MQQNQEETAIDVAKEYKYALSSFVGRSTIKMIKSMPGFHRHAATGHWPSIDSPLFLDAYRNAAQKEERYKSRRYPLLSIFVANTIKLMLETLCKKVDKLYMICGDSLQMPVAHIEMAWQCLFSGFDNKYADQPKSKKQSMMIKKLKLELTASYMHKADNNIYSNFFGSLSSLTQQYAAVALMNDSSQNDSSQMSGEGNQTYFVLLIPMIAFSKKFTGMDNIHEKLSMGHRFKRIDGTRNVFGLMDLIDFYGEYMERTLARGLLEAMEQC